MELAMIKSKEGMYVWLALVDYRMNVLFAKMAREILLNNAKKE